MSVLYGFNRFIERHMVFVAPLCLLFGVLTADWTAQFNWLVPYFFLVMAFEGSLGTDFRSFAHVLVHPKVLIIQLLLLHVAMPLIGLGAGMAFFGSSPGIITGIILEAISPVGVVALTWSGIYKGNISLTLSIVVADIIIAPILIPVMLHLLLHSTVDVSPFGIMLNLLFMVALPAFLAMLLNAVTHNKAREKVQPPLKPFSKIAMILVISLNSTKAAPYFRHMTLRYFLVIVLMFFMVVAGFLIAYGAARLMRLSRDKVVSMLYTGGIRNIAAAAIIAIQFFPGEAIFPVMSGTLFQQVTAGILSDIFFRDRKPK